MTAIDQSQATIVSKDIIIQVMKMNMRHIGNNSESRVRFTDITCDLREYFPVIICYEFVHTDI